VAEAAVDPPHDYLARWITLATSISFDRLLGLSEERLGRVLALSVVRSSFLWSSAGQKVLFESATDEADRWRSDVDTAESVFTRLAVTSSATGRENEAFCYSGPIDGLLRPFCEARVGRVFSRKAIDAMDNGQLPNVLATCGGHQCRHTWLPVPPLDDLAALADTGQFATPEEEQDLAQVPDARARLREWAGLPPEADGARAVCPGPAAWREREQATRPKRRSVKRRKATSAPAVSPEKG
jgi:hypothetical protein